MKKNKFKENLRRTREEKGLLQTEVANSLCINATTYRNYENTDREPDYDTLIKISEILNISIDDLLGCQHANKLPVTPTNFTSDEKSLLHLYRLLSDQSKGKIQERTKMLLEEEHLNSKESNRKNA